MSLVENFKWLNLMTIWNSNINFFVISKMMFHCRSLNSQTFSELEFLAWWLGTSFESKYHYFNWVVDINVVLTLQSDLHMEMMKNCCNYSRT